MRGWPVLARNGAAIALVAGLLAAAPARAAPLEQLCGGTAHAGVSDGALEKAAGDTERSLLRRGAADGEDRSLQSLDVMLSGVEAPKAEALGRYCSAAGETMRVSRAGSQFQAQRYLLSALRLARRGGDIQTEARAAYRLGLASAGGSAGAAGTRGGVRVTVAASAPAAVDPAPRDACAPLFVQDILAQPDAVLARLALACATSRAATAGLPDLAALAAFRRARLEAALAAAQPNGSEALLASARGAVGDGLSLVTDVPSPALRAEIAGRLVSASLDLGGADAIALGASVAMMRAAAADPATQAFAAALEGRLALAGGDRPHAIDALERAVFLESQRPQPLRLADWLLWLAQADPARHDAHVLAAYRAIEAVRPLLPLTDPLTEEPSFALHIRPVFQAAVAVELGGGVQGDEATRIASAQSIVEEFRQAEIQSVFGANCVAARDPVRPAELRAREVLLYPVLLPDRVELIYAVNQPGQRPRYRRIVAAADMARSAVADQITRLVTAISTPGDAGWRAPARTLYDVLVKPIEAELPVGATLVIVPDGPLRALPFAALTDARGHFLAERVAIAVAPALAYSQPGADRSRRPLEVVAAALERPVTLPAGAFGELAGTGAEARAVVAASGSPRSRVIENFHAADLRAALAERRPDVLHLATHAAFNGRSDRSFIVADGEAIPLADLHDLIDGKGAGGQLDLLVLSACETAVGDDQASMGLAGSAVQAGAQSALASLWEVNDVGTAELMKSFYARYRGGESKAAALRDAQLALIARGGAVAEPNVWAAFTLLGGWR